jgi:hypothetical protein
VSYCWLYDLVIYGFYTAFDLAGFSIFLAIMWVLIIAELASILHRLQPSLPLTFALALTAYISLSHQYTPRPWLFSMLALLLELDIVLTAGRRKNYRLLLLLPPLFLLWTTLHAQFLNGLLVLGTFLVESAAVRFFRLPAVLDQSDTVPCFPMLAAFLGSVAATFATPYHYHIYETVWELGTEMQLWNLIADHKAMSFRLVSDWFVLGITVAAAMAIGWHKQVRLSLLLTYLGGIVCAFRGARDSWLVVFPGMILLGQCVPVPAGDRVPIGWPRALGVGIPALALVVLLGKATLSNDRLEELVAERWPRELADFVTAKGYPGPLANHHDWGGYLMWRLRTMPVTMDQRTTVHHESRIIPHLNAWSGGPNWEDDPELKAANVVLVEYGLPLAQLLKRDPRFEMVFDDGKHGLVFVRRSSAAASNPLHPITP